jgi:repressor LexA
MSKKLTDRQEQIYHFIDEYIKENQYAPTLREIGNKFGIVSTFGVQRHLEALSKKGYIQKGNNTSRTLSLVKSAETGYSDPFKCVPILGRVAAGVPITAIENMEGNLLLDSSFLKSRDEHFALKVKGDSMIEDGIFDGDFVIVCPTNEVSHDEIIVAMLRDEVTVKRFYHKGSQIQLIPGNKAYQPIPIKNFEDFSIIGKVVGVMRWIA